MVQNVPNIIFFITHVASKVTEFQLHNLIASLACYMIVCDPRYRQNEASEIQAPVVQTLDSAIHRINHYPLDNSIGFASVYPLDSDLSGGQRYPSFQQLGPGL